MLTGVGLGVAAFGGGAVVCAPAAGSLMEKFSETPQLLGTTDTVNVVTQAGVRMAEVNGSLQEVVIGTANSVGTNIVDGGVYLAGTGDTGLAATFATLGAGYFVSSRNRRHPSAVGIFYRVPSVPGDQLN